MLGCVLYPVFLAAAWTPLAVERFSRARPWPEPAPHRDPRSRAGGAGRQPRRGSRAATALFALVLVPRWPGRRVAAAAAGSLLLAALARGAGPLWRRGDARGHCPRAGASPPDVGLSYSAPLPVLLEVALPRFLGDLHTFSDAGFWGQPFYPGGSPFFLSLYLGPVVLLLAACAGWRGRRAAVGARGSGRPDQPWRPRPARPALAPLMGPLRVPAQVLPDSTLALALLAGEGIDRARRTRPGWLPWSPACSSSSSRSPPRARRRPSRRFFPA